MHAQDENELETLLALMFKAHPWHGIRPETTSPDTFQAYIEIVPVDTVKYELDKPSGLLRIDRPQLFSSACPTLYGFVPQTYCGPRVAKRCHDRTQEGEEGDGDPLDICVLSEKPFASGNFLLRARPIGGLRMVDTGQADDKIVAVLESDVAFGELRDITEAPKGLVERLRHYFLTYKQLPQEAPRKAAIREIYSRDEALEVIRLSQLDYQEKFGDPRRRLDRLRELLRANG